MLAQALLFNKLGREKKEQWTSPANRQEILRILSYFEDQPSAPFSIHKISQFGTKMTKQIGEWFGPSTIVHAISHLFQYLKDDLNGLNLYVAKDGVLYLDQIPSFTADEFQPLLILIPLRLGVEHLNPMYFPALFSVMRFPQTLGIIGGKRWSSMYYVGAVAGAELLYFDPHTVQVAVSPAENLESYRWTGSVLAMGIEDIDPSLALGFLCNTRADLTNLISAVEGELKHGDFLFSVESTTPEYLKENPSVPSQSQSQSQSGLGCDAFASFDELAFAPASTPALDGSLPDPLKDALLVNRDIETGDSADTEDHGFKLL